jgi:hypothetical protein
MLNDGGRISENGQFYLIGQPGSCDYILPLKFVESWQEVLDKQEGDDVE